MPPGREPIPLAHTSVPGRGEAERPEKTMSRKSGPDKKTSSSTSWGAPFDASVCWSLMLCSSLGPPTSISDRRHGQHPCANILCTQVLTIAHFCYCLDRVDLHPTGRDPR